MALGGGGGIRQQIVLDGVDDILRKLGQLETTGTKTFTSIGRAADHASGGINNFAKSITQGAGLAGLTRGFADLGKAGSAALLTLGGFGTSVGIAGGILAIANSIGKAKDEILEIRRLSQATGFDPTAIKAINETIEDLGGEAGSGNRALLRLSQAFSEVRQAARNAGEAIGKGVKTLRGSSAATDKLRTDVDVLRGSQQNMAEGFTGVQVGRGGVINKTEVKDASDAMRVLRVDLTRFKDDAAGNTAAIQAVIDGFNRLEKAGQVDLGNLVAEKLVGVKSMASLVPALKALGTEAGGLVAKMRELSDQDRGITPEQVQRALEYQKALKDLRDQSEVLGFTLLKTFGPFLSEQLRLFTSDIENLGRAFAEGQTWDIVKFFLFGGEVPTGQDFGGGGPGWIERNWVEPTKNALATMRDLIVEFVPQIPGLFADAWKAIWDGFTAGARAGIDTVWGWLKDLGSGISSALSKLAGGGGGAAATAPIPSLGNAAGGLITGPGTGTSDSILTRLSNGEFVVNAAATAANLPLLRALNDGLLPRGRRGFATGGLVTAAAGGTPVHLHIGNGEFALSGSSNVVDRLVKEAHRQHIRSAGIKPSWYGGR